MESSRRSRSRWIRAATAVVAIAVHLSLFLSLCRSFRMSYVTREAWERNPEIILYFSPHKTANQLLYVVFYPWIQLRLLATSHVEFAHSGPAFMGVIVQEGVEAQPTENLEDDRSTPGRACAPLVWGVLAFLLLLRLARSEQRCTPARAEHGGQGGAHTAEAQNASETEAAPL